MLEEHESNLSNILGWVSIACWIVVYSPQVYENYQLQSGEGLSVSFVLVWLVGDIFNLLGAIKADLLPTVIILAVYYMLCDVTLLGQVYFYRWKRSRAVTVREPDECDEWAALLGNAERDENETYRPPDAPRGEIAIPTKILVIRYAAALVFVVATGIAAWWISELIDWGEGDIPSPPSGMKEWVIQSLGWSSAVLYLGARIPQISKNFKTRCEGLSPALFFFAIFGNVTYAWSICAKSMEISYILTNAGWLAGSTLTILMDIIVLCQFFYYHTVDGEQLVREERN